MAEPRVSTRAILHPSPVQQTFEAWCGEARSRLALNANCVMAILGVGGRRRGPKARWGEATGELVKGKRG
eukprot:9491362-Pyramimonas_sp.AAC.1